MKTGILVLVLLLMALAAMSGCRTDGDDSDSRIVDSQTVTPIDKLPIVPEPQGLWLLGMGMAGLLAWRKNG